MIGRAPKPAYASPKIERAFSPPEPSYVVQIHDHDCPCPACAPYLPSRPDTLTANNIGKLTVAGIVVGLLIILAIDPAALLAMFGL